MMCRRAIVFHVALAIAGFGWVSAADACNCPKEMLSKQFGTVTALGPEPPLPPPLPPAKAAVPPSGG